MRIALGCDHHGLTLKQKILDILEESGHKYRDFGCYSEEPVDYPDIAKEVAEEVALGNFDRGILICATGIGMSIAANKVKGVRAALCCDKFSAEMARRHNDANILCLGAERIEHSLACEIVSVYLSTNFDGGRHLRRVGKIRRLEGD
jgi:ribose 5-phosphate isomerase B